MKYTFEELNIRKQTRYKSAHNKEHINNGLDTETLNGYAKLICDDSGRYALINDIDDLLRFLTHQKFKSAFNWFFNIRFDFESIIKYFPIDILYELYENNYYKYYTYEIRYIDKKFFSIRNNNNTYTFYDLNAFLSTSLNNASKTFLNDTKLDIIDSERLNIDKQYWNNNIKGIIKYCIYDAKLTKRLADYFWSLMYEHIGFLPRNPYSKGSFSQEYFLHKCYIPTINNINKGALKYAYNAYSGGRFEILKRGYFDNIITYDLKSAYPKEMLNLIDYNLGEWFYTTNFDENAYDGFYNCRIKFFHELISPFMHKMQTLNIYPNGEFNQYLTQKEILFITNNFDVDISIIDGFYFYPKFLRYPLKEEIEKLYAWKESEKDPTIKYMVKIILNSLYGKFIQKVGGNTGKIFNPIWAANITANTRLKLIEAALINPDNVIGFSTDSIHTEKSLNICGNGEIGSWEKDFEGKGLVIMSDIYALWNEQKKKNRFRGFRILEEEIQDDYDNIENKKNKVRSIIDILDLMGDNLEYKYQTERPRHLGESLRINDLTPENINVWFTEEKSININGDIKRIWDKEFRSAKNVYTENHNSVPLLILD